MNLYTIGSPPATGSSHICYIKWEGPAKGPRGEDPVHQPSKQVTLDGVRNQGCHGWAQIPLKAAQHYHS